MSHIVTIQTEIRDLTAVQRACQRLCLPEPVLGTITLFATPVTGWQVQLPNWQFPVVCDLESSRLHFDNYEGRWGDQVHLDRFLQAYAVEQAKLEARKKGYLALEQPLADGSIKLTIQTGA